MKNTQLAALMVFGTMLSGCHSVPGVLTAFQNFEAVNKWNKTFTVAAGKYDAKIDIHSKRQLSLKVKDVQGWRDQEMRIRIPSGQPIPSDSGTFHLRGSDTGQPFDLDGAVDTQSVETPVQQGSESCSLTHTEYQCFYYPQYHCENITVTLSGSRAVSYHSINTTRTIDVAFGNQVASFHATETSNRLVYDYWGPCVLN